MGTLDPRGSATIGPSGLISNINVGDTLTLLHTKYISIGPIGFKKEDVLKVFPL